ncbi:MAG: helix-turn-helix transcriptional regulator [Thermaerobacter sp.]|nr:helix-turn-helix transcriptional regulator [Thermaerobacter sp.]
MDDFDRFLHARLASDKEFRKEWEKSELPATVAQALLSLRAKLGITQTELARRAGIPQSEIARLEGMSHLPSLRTLEKIAKAVGAVVDVSIRLSNRVAEDEAEAADAGFNPDKDGPLAAARG